MTSPHQLCWYCGREPAVETKADRFDLYGNLGKNPAGRVTYQTTTVRIPRCAACAGAHTREGCLSVFAFLVGGLLGVLAYAALSQWIAKVTGWATFIWWLMVGFGAAGGAVGIGVASPLARKVLGDRRSGTASSEYPPIRELLDGGWKQGTKPPKAR